ncbi:phosphate acyltransferase PlsX [Pseudalkalibacillus salsuginis]|uniref:phosphate acyltransferase PlsX n=1 Tax=Pseudalkalibacillus salsuginis TaxID=2910972 RepID=UPI001F1E1E89|nr:phosphate acyltransferase PlsX [Pseudalkalibacillus salsuginis]MCF6410531.1 phosphate acyltransferase PlsX [Pseudalkalibacillus salsuginis]
MKIAIDAMGGDHAPEQIVLGAVEAVNQYADLEVVLVGDENKLIQYLSGTDRVSIIHTSEMISSGDEPVRAVRRKKQASMVLSAVEVKEGRADACISAGNTGALMTTGLLHIGRIPGIERPALSPTLPTLDGQGFVLLDVGSNMDAKPEHIFQYALMGSVYSEKVRGIGKPRVGLLNVGTEDGKGNELSKQTFQLLKETDLVHFVGNVESRDLLDGVADVVVCDGFSGNLVLKTIEGTALLMFKMLKEQLMSSVKSKLAAAVLKPEFKAIKEKLDYSEYGGAALFGLRAPVIKAHGSSDANAVLNAIRQARHMVEHDMVRIITEKAVRLEGKE